MSWYPAQSNEETRSFQTYGNELTSTKYPSSGPSPGGTRYLSNPSASIPSLPRHANVSMAPSDQSGYGDGQQLEYSYGDTATHSGHPYYLDPRFYHQRMLSNPSVATEASSVGYQYSVVPTAGQHSHYPSSSPIPPSLREHDDNNWASTVESQQISAERSLALVEDRTEELAASVSSREAHILRVKRKNGKDFKHGNMTVPFVDVPTWDQVAAVTGKRRSTISKKGREDDLWDITVIGKFPAQSPKRRKTDKELDPEHRANISAGSENVKWYRVWRKDGMPFSHREDVSVTAVKLRGQEQVVSLTGSSPATIRRNLNKAGGSEAVLGKIWVIEELDEANPSA